MWLGLCSDVTVTRMRLVVSGTVGGRIAGAYHALCEQVFCKRECSFGIADEDRHDRTDAGGQVESQLGQS